MGQLVDQVVVYLEPALSSLTPLGAGAPVRTARTVGELILTGHATWLQSPRERTASGHRKHHLRQFGGALEA